MVQNFAAEETGRWGGQLRAQAFGLTGLGDTTYVSFYSTSDFKEQQILQAGHSFRPGSEGLVDQRPVHLCLDQAGRSGSTPTTPSSRRGPCSRRSASPTRCCARNRRILSVGGGLRLRQPEDRFLRAAEPRPAAHPVGAGRFRRHRPALAPAEMAGRGHARGCATGIDVFDASKACTRRRLSRRGDDAAEPVRCRPDRRPWSGSTARPSSGSAIRWRVAVSPRAQYALRPAAVASSSSPPAITPSAAAMTRRP